jgi:hypothetical protein
MKDVKDISRILYRIAVTAGVLIVAFRAAIPYRPGTGK